MTPESRIAGIKFIVGAAFFAAAICVPIVLIADSALMPSKVELKEIDRLVQERITADGPGCTALRLSAPDRVQKSGDVKKGYFTYSVRCVGGSRNVRASWIIKDGRVEVTSVRSP